MSKRNERSRILKSVFACMICFSLLFTPIISVNANDVPEAVIEVQKSVVRLEMTNWVLVDKTGAEHPEAGVNAGVAVGSGFLIGTDDSSLDTVLTCGHNTVGEATGHPNYILKPTKFTVVIGRDVKIETEIISESPQGEFAVLKLKRPLANRKAAVLHTGEHLGVGKAVYALGFPEDMVETQLQPEFEAENVILTNGTVSKYGNESNLYGANLAGSYVTPCYSHTAGLSGGNSGGPLVDNNGVVIGINIFLRNNGDTTRNFSSDIDLAITVLNGLGIEYKQSDGGSKGDDDEIIDKPVVPTLDTSVLSSLLKKANDINAADYTEESYAALKEAIQEANDALTSDSQEDINAAADDLDDAIQGLEVKKTNQFVLIGVIAAVAAIIIAVVVVLIVLAKKKKQPASAAPVAPAVPAAPAPAVSAPTPAPAPVQVSNETSVLNQGAGETSVLSQGAGETTVLSQQVNGGLLTRTSNNERIPVNSAEFTIGRERNKVDYCVGGNTNISRIHARFVVREGKTYIVDNKAANGTFVNGIKARPGQEIELKSGDKIVLADEKFEFTK